jgi:hypothetical protein
MPTWNLSEETNRDYRAKGVDEMNCCMAAFDHQREHEVFPRDMKTTTFIYRPTKARWAAFGSCHAQGSKQLVMDRAVSGRAAE